MRGVFGFPVTPFKKDLSLDLDALARNVDEMAGSSRLAVDVQLGGGSLPVRASGSPSRNIRCRADPPDSRPIPLAIR